MHKWQPLIFILTSILAGLACIYMAVYWPQRIKTTPKLLVEDNQLFLHTHDLSEAALSDATLNVLSGMGLSSYAYVQANAKDRAILRGRLADTTQWAATLTDDRIRTAYLEWLDTIKYGCDKIDGSEAAASFIPKPPQ